MAKTIEIPIRISFISKPMLFFLHYILMLNSFLLQIVKTLCLFLTPAERKCSRLCEAESSFKYESGLFVQGLLKVESTLVTSETSF